MRKQASILGLLEAVFAQKKAMSLMSFTFANLQGCAAVPGAQDGQHLGEAAGNGPSNFSQGTLQKRRSSPGSWHSTRVQGSQGPSRALCFTPVFRARSTSWNSPQKSPGLRQTACQLLVVSASQLKEHLSIYPSMYLSLSLSFPLLLPILLFVLLFRGFEGNRRPPPGWAAHHVQPNLLSKAKGL